MYGPLDQQRSAMVKQDHVTCFSSA